MAVLKQLPNLIPLGMANRHARETGVDAKARTLSVMSPLRAMLFARLSHAVGLYDVRTNAPSLRPLRPFVTLALVADACGTWPERYGRGFVAVPACHRRSGGLRAGRDRHREPRRIGQFVICRWSFSHLPDKIWLS